VMSSSLVIGSLHIRCGFTVIHEGGINSFPGNAAD
jgi:hypothetical protein